MASNWGQQSQYGEFKIVGAAEGKAKLLGKGSFGRTYEAVVHDDAAGKIFERRYALKVMDPELLGSRSKREAFHEEIQSLIEVSHPNLIRFVRTGETPEGEVYLAMDLCAGGDLTKLVRRYGALPERVAALIALQVAEGLKEMERCHKIHRDIKPTNIMLFREIPADTSIDQFTEMLDDQANLCRIVDFGLVGTAFDSKEAGDAAQRQRFVGSPMYASPEQMKQRPETDHRADIYALGMTLWYLVQGRGPLLDERGDELQDPRDAIKRHLSAEEHEAALPENLTQGFRSILSRMVAKRAADRHTNARALCEALNHYLESSKAPASSQSYPLVRSSATLDATYRLTQEFPSPSGWKRFYAEHRTRRGERSRVTIVEDLADPGKIRNDYNDVVEKVTALARRLTRMELPQELLKVREVVEAKDALAYVEEIPSHMSLGSVLQARRKASRAVSFREVVPMLRPLAAALDFLIAQGWDHIFLTCDEVWLSSSELPAAESEAVMLGTPLDEWPDLKIKLSAMWVPSKGAAMSLMFDSMHGSSVVTSNALRHPATAFLCLVYRIVEGMEVADLAEIADDGYDPTAQLQAASNNLIRDILCNKRQRSTVTTLLNELCAHEGIDYGVPIIPTGPSVELVTESGTIAPGSSRPPQTANATARGGSGSRPRRMAAVDESLPVCQVVAPGVVIPPDDPERRQQNVPADEWRVNGTVTSEFSGRPFRLPRVLKALVIEPGVVRSPYSITGRDQKVTWDRWQPGTEINCEDTGEPFFLPDPLPYPPATLPREGTGKVISPYPPHPAVQVAARDWEPGTKLKCPNTGYTFVLPDDLPPLEAVVDVAKPGRFTSPFAPQAVGIIDTPRKWNKGEKVTCPTTGRPLALPAQVEGWLAEAVIIDAATRTIGSPFSPGSKWALPAANWKRGGIIDCQASFGRKLSLPLDLPPLAGELVAAEVGKVRSPYTGEVVIVQISQWVPGGEVQCPKSGQPFRLPGKLPLPDGIIAATKRPGTITSPYDASCSFAVEPLNWNTGEIVKCQKTGLEFKLPKNLPLREALVESSRPGFARSPFAPNDKELEIDLDHWIPGGQFDCPFTGRPFELPRDLQSWIVDGHWMPRRPGNIRSPFHDGRVFSLSEAEWSPGHICEYEDHGIKRRFSVPADSKLPTLALEKEAVKQARANPEADEKAAATSLKALHPGATAEAIEAIWKRHDIDTKEKRLGWQETGMIDPDEPGCVVSPYEGHARVKVDPLVWIDPKASVLCPETKQRFLLPSPRPPLLAGVSNSAPGFATSPFKPDEPFRIDPWNWNAGAEVRCLFTSHPLRMPRQLPPWVPEAQLADRKPGEVIDPFSAGRDIVAVPGAEWVAKKVVTIGGHTFSLPEKLPRLIADLNKTARGKVESPYAPGSKPIAVPADEWKAGGIVVCPTTGLEFELPEGLADDPFEGIDPRDDGTIQSPYGSGKRFLVHPLKWAADEIVADDDGRRVMLPAKLPLLTGKVDDDRPCEVASPFAPDKWMRVSINEWEPGREIKCGESHRAFRLPEGPLPAPEGTIVKPGVALSPWKNEVTVPPDQWEPGALIEDRKNRRVFRVPKINVPLLEGRTLPGKTLCIRSPFDQSEVHVSLDDWKPGAEIVCPSTHKRFVLPANLADPVLPARVIAEHRGWIVDPFTKRDYEVPAKDWLPGKIIPSETSPKRLIQLPEELPPLVASLIAEKPGSIRSPFKPEREITVKRAQWQPGTVLPCKWTKRPIELPKHLPAYPEGGTGVSKPLLIIAALAACLTVAGGLAWQFRGKIGGGGTGTDNGSSTSNTGDSAKQADTSVANGPQTDTTRKDDAATTGAAGKTQSGMAAIGTQETPKPDSGMTPAPPPPPSREQLLAEAKNAFAQAPADRQPVKAREYLKLLADPATFDSLPPAGKLANLREQFSARLTANELKPEHVGAIEEIAKAAANDPAAQTLADESLSAAAAIEGAAYQNVRDEALLAIARLEAQRAGGEATPKAIDAHLTAYEQTQNPAAFDWLAGSAGKMAIDLFNKVVGSLRAGDQLRFIDAATKSKNDEVAAQAFVWSVPGGLEAIQSGTAPLEDKAKLLLLEAASRNGGMPSEAARELLTKRVQARLASAAARQVFDPFSSDPTPITIEPADWKPGGVISKPEKKQFFRLPASFGALVVKFDPEKHVKPNGGKPGSIGFDGTNTTVAVDARHWYRGSKIKGPDGKEQATLPDDLPPLEIPADEARALAIQEKKPVVMSPVTRERIDLKWTDWRPGCEVRENVDGMERVVAVLAPGQPAASLDPRLSSRSPKLLMQPDYDATKAEEPPTFEFTVVSPYTNTDARVPVTSWWGNKDVIDSTVPGNGSETLSLKMQLPEALLPIPGILDPKNSGLFRYRLQSGEEATPIKLTEMRPKDFEPLNEFEYSGQRFKILGKLRFDVADGGKKAVDPRTGSALDAAEMRLIVDEIQKNKRAGASYTDDFDSASRGKPAASKKEDDKKESPKMAKVDPPRGKSADEGGKPPKTTKQPMVVTNDPPKPTSQTPPSPEPKPQPSPKGGAVDSRYAKNFVAPMNGIFFSYKNGIWAAKKGAMLPGGNPVEFGNRLEQSLKLSGKIPKSGKVNVRGDGSIIIVVP